MKSKNVQKLIPYFQPTLLPVQLIELQEALASANDEEYQQKAAVDIIREFYGFFGADGMRKDMWLLLSRSITGADNGKMHSAADRYNLFFFYEFALIFFDAVYVLHGDKKFGILENT